MRVSCLLGDYIGIVHHPAQGQPCRHVSNKKHVLILSTIFIIIPTPERMADMDIDEEIDNGTATTTPTTTNE